MEHYEKPVVEEYGTLTELTLALNTGNTTDVPLGTKGFNVLTCDPTTSPACITI